MRFLTDENIQSSLVKVIRRKGHSVKDIKEEKLIGSKDKEIMTLAKKEKLIIITFDKDFATFPIEKHCGVVLLRYKNKSTNNVITQFSYLLDSPTKEKFENSLCEVFDNYIKIQKA